MHQTPWSPLADAPIFPRDGYAPLAERIGKLLHTKNDVLLIQGEAVVALEAVAQSLGRRDLRALNLVSSLYGRWFGGWLRRTGAEVVDLMAEEGKPLDVIALRQALGEGRFDLVALVHAESAYGIVNPLEDIVAAAKAAGALVVVDAVASLGGHPLAVDALGIDVAVIGPQKSLGGQAGVSAVSLSPAAWAAVAPAGEAPSILSLADQRALWLDQGRGALPGTPSALEFHALKQCLDRVEAEGLPQIEARHALAARMARAGALALTGRQWVTGDRGSNLVTAVVLPDGLSADRLLDFAPAGHGLSAGVGGAGQRLIRLNHTGPRAQPQVVLGDLLALAQALKRAGHQADIAATLAAAGAAA